MSKFFSKKVRMGRISIPVWTSVLALAVTGLAAGQAVGPVLAGSVTGIVGLTVEQATTLDTSYDLGNNPSVYVGDPTDFVSTFNDEGTEFMVAMEMHVGENVELVFNLSNDSGVSGSAALELNIPAGVDVEIGSDSDLDEAQLGANSWLMVVPEGTSNFTMEIEPKDDLAPGFYTINGRLVQISG